MTCTLTLFKRLPAARMSPDRAEVLVEELLEIRKAMPLPQSASTLPARCFENAL